MGRRAAPWTIYDKGGAAWINAKIGDQRARKPLGLPYVDPGSPGHDERLREAAAKVYAALVQGRSLGASTVERVQTAHTLPELLAVWLVEDAQDYPASASLATTHARHFKAFAAAGADRRTPLERLAADAGPTDYVLHRLRAVLKETVIKEVSTLFRFYNWAKKREHFASLPPRPAWPQKAVGVHAGTQRREPVTATHAQLRDIIAALPVRSKGIPVRDLGELAYETGLRPSTIARLSVPEHYRKGADSLWVPPEIDKGRNKPVRLPLSKRAREIMDRHVEGKAGIIFGKHDLRVQWKRAAASVLGPEGRPEDFSVYDFRHGAGRRFVKLAGLQAAQYMLNHKRATTTNRYVQPSEADGLAAVEAMDKAESKRR